MNILVTGASSGIGKSLVTYFVAQGHSVWGMARRPEEFKKLQQELSQEKGVFRWNAGDVRKREDIVRMHSDMREASFFPEAVYLAAGIFPNDITPRFNFELFTKTMETNAGGALCIVDAFLDEFLKRGTGHFVALSSTAAFRPNRRGIGYPASKAALALAFRGLQLAYQDKNILYSIVYLGPISSPMWEGRRSFFVADEQSITRKLAAVIQTRRNTYYLPFFSTFLFRVSRWLPDRWYAAVAERVLK